MNTVVTDTGPGVRTRPGFSTGISDAIVLDLRVYGALAAGLIVAQIWGALGRSGAVTPVACGIMLLFGLPHGTLDVRLIVRQYRLSVRQMTIVVALYVGLMAATWAIWQWDATAGLGLFLCLSVWHFAEDWDSTGSRFIAGLCAVALLTAPMFFHGASLIALFGDLAPQDKGGGAMPLIPGAMLLLAPVALCGGVVGAVMQWRGGDRPAAMATAVTFTAMLVLPPVVGFAMFFCALHSPRHLRQAMRDMWTAVPRRHHALWYTTIAPLTALSLVLAAVLFAAHPAATVSARAMLATFVTLSMLTVPHMAVPWLLAAQRQIAVAARRPSVR